MGDFSLYESRSQIEVLDQAPMSYTATTSSFGLNKRPDGYPCTCGHGAEYGPPPVSVRPAVILVTHIL
jgi:hypothetical protein